MMRAPWATGVVWSMALALVPAGVLGGALTGCGPGAAPAPEAGGGQAAAEVTNRVDIPPSVRENLGITFAPVEMREVARTLRVPGHFELLPTARREYRAPARGRVEVLVEQYAAVEAGTVLYRLDSAEWREMQRELAGAEEGVRLAQAAADNIGPLLEAHEVHHTEIQVAVDLWTERVGALEALQAAGGARADEMAQARASLASARSDLAQTLEKEAELAARRVETAARLEAAGARLEFLLASASVLTGESVDGLRAPAPGGGAGARWAQIAAIEVRALSPGVVELVHAVSGGGVDELGAVVTVVQPGQVRFRAVGLQSDLPRLGDGQAVTIVPAQRGASEVVRGNLTLAPTADPERRTIELVVMPAGGQALPTWARAGVAAFAEVVTSGSGRAELAIPLRCVARDGTEAIIFRRDPANPDKVIRMPADLGIDDGRWVVVRSGVGEGNQVVLDGVYQLMVATSGSVTRGGHFHPDGTFHEGED